MKLAEISGAKKKGNLKAKMEKFEFNSKMKTIRNLYRGISDFKKGYQPRTDTVKDEKCNLVTDCNSILDRRWNHISQLLNVHGVSDDRNTHSRTISA